LYAILFDHAATPAQLPEFAVGEAEMPVLVETKEQYRFDELLLEGLVAPELLVVAEVKELLVLVDLVLGVILLMAVLVEDGKTDWPPPVQALTKR
jgi:hypothetical protein